MSRKKKKRKSNKHIDSEMELKDLFKLFDSNLNKSEDRLDDIVESDENYYFIAGYTSNGVPYGVTWEEMGIDRESMIDDEDLPFS